MKGPDKPRLLGRGVPPSQPVPQHLAPASFDEAPAPRAPRPLVVAGAAAVGLLTVAALGATLWHTLLRPEPKATAPALSAFAQQAASADPVDLALATGDDLRVKTDIVTIERVWIDACQRPGLGRTPPDECDRQPYFERALVKAIVENGKCAPERPKDESISYALEVHHRLRKTRLFVGKSGTLRASDAKTAVDCVARALPEPDWDSIEHQHTRYVIGALATYPAVDRQ